MSKNKKGLKLDQGKQQWYAMPLEVLEPLADAFVAGEPLHSVVMDIAAANPRTVNTSSAWSVRSCKTGDGMTRWPLITGRAKMKNSVIFSGFVWNR